MKYALLSFSPPQGFCCCLDAIVVIEALSWALDWNVVSRSEKRGKEQKRPLNLGSFLLTHRLALPLLRFPSDSSFPYIDGPTSLARGEGHLMSLTSMVGKERVGDGDGGWDEQRTNRDQRLILVSNSDSMV